MKFRWRFPLALVVTIAFSWIGPLVVRHADGERATVADVHVRETATPAMISEPTLEIIPSDPEKAHELKAAFIAALTRVGLGTGLVILLGALAWMRLIAPPRPPRK